MRSLIVFAVLSIVKFVPFVFMRNIVICLSVDGHHITPYTLLSESAGLFTSITLFVDKISSGKGILHHVDAGHSAVMSIYFGNLPFERVYTYLERERIAKAVLFLYTKIVAVFPYTVVQIPGPRIREEKKVRMRWR